MSYLLLTVNDILDKLTVLWSCDESDKRGSGSGQMSHHSSTLDSGSYR